MGLTRLKSRKAFFCLDNLEDMESSKLGYVQVDVLKRGKPRVLQKYI